MIRILMAFAAWVSIFACGPDNNSTNPSVPIVDAPANKSTPYLGANGPNVVPIQVGGMSVCGQKGYVNEPCASVTICVPGTNTCQTISDVLIDTGSVGLRLFSSVVTIALPAKTDSAGHNFAECAQFATGSDWGPLASADVVLGQEPPVTVPIQLINKSYVKVPGACAQADTDPQQAGFNGILGVGFFAEDCGTTCAANSSVQLYFTCDTATCATTAIDPTNQVQNPIPHLPEDNNGIVIAMPPVPPEGLASATGVMLLGVGTRANNGPNGVTMYTTDDAGNFTTSFQDQTLSGSFIDSGSNGIFFPDLANLPGCSSSGPAPGLYCPSSLQDLTAYNFSGKGNVQARIQFSVGNAESQISANIDALSDLGGPSSQGFDWGFPFFYGRAVFEGIMGKPSILGMGPYWAY